MFTDWHQSNSSCMNQPAYKHNVKAYSCLQSVKIIKTDVPLPNQFESAVICFHCYCSLCLHFLLVLSSLCFGAYGVSYIYGLQLSTWLPFFSTYHHHGSCSTYLCRYQPVFYFFITTYFIHATNVLWAWRLWA